MRCSFVSILRIATDSRICTSNKGMTTANQTSESSYQRKISPLMGVCSLLSFGPIKGAQPAGTTWANGFPHTAWFDMSEYYITAFKTGVYPDITVRNFAHSHCLGLIFAPTLRAARRHLLLGTSPPSIGKCPVRQSRPTHRFHVDSSKILLMPSCRLLSHVGPRISYGPQSSPHRLAP